MSIRREAHIEEKERICPNCGAKGSIIFSKAIGKQATLEGSEEEVWRSIKPTCIRCGKKFSKGTLFREVR